MIIKATCTESDTEYSLTYIAAVITCCPKDQERSFSPKFVFNEMFHG